MKRDGRLPKNFPTESLSLRPAVEMLRNRGQSRKETSQACLHVVACVSSGLSQPPRRVHAWAILVILRLCRSCHRYRVSLAGNARTLLISFSNSGTPVQSNLYPTFCVCRCETESTRRTAHAFVTQHCQTCECLCDSGMQVAVTASAS